MHGDVFALFPLFLLHKRHVSRIAHRASRITHHLHQQKSRKKSVGSNVARRVRHHQQVKCYLWVQVQELVFRVRGGGFRFLFLGLGFRVYPFLEYLSSMFRKRAEAFP